MVGYAGSASSQRHRVLVIDRLTRQIIWQYAVTDTPGHAPGYLFYPDGMDIDPLPRLEGRARRALIAMAQRS